MPIESPAITPPGIEPLSEASFYIPATEPTTRLRRSMKQDDCFLVFDSHGDIGASPGGPDGLFYCDTRYLSHFELLSTSISKIASFCRKTFCMGRERSSSGASACFTAAKFRC